MDEYRGQSRGGSRGRAPGAQASASTVTAAAMYSFTVAPGPEVTSVLHKPQRGGRPITVPELPLAQLMQNKSQSFTAQGASGVHDMSGGPGNGGPPLSNRALHSAGDASYRDLDSSMRGPSELSFYRDNRIIHPWDLASSTPEAVARAARPGAGALHSSYAAGPGGVQSMVYAVSSSALPFGGGTHGAVGPGRTGLGRANASSSHGYVGGRRQSDTEGLSVSASTGGLPFQGRQRASVPKLMLQGISPQSSSAQQGVDVGAQEPQQQQQQQYPHHQQGPSAPQPAAHLQPLPGQLQQVYAHANGHAAGGDSVLPAEPRKRSFELDPMPGAAAGSQQGASGNAAAALAAGGSAKWATQPQPQAEGQWAARVEGDAAAGAAAAASAANGARPMSQPARPGNGIIALPQPSSLYGPASAALANKLPPRSSPRRSPRDSPRDSPRAMSANPTAAAAGSNLNKNSSSITTSGPLPLAPHSQAAAAAAALLPGSPPHLPWIASATAPGSFQSASTVSVPQSSTASLPAQTTSYPYLSHMAGGSGQASGHASDWEDACAGAPGQADRAQEPSMGVGDEAQEGGAMMTPTTAMLEQQRAGRTFTIEDILMGTAAAPPKGLSQPANPQQQQQVAAQAAFRAVHPRAKPPSREDVAEVQAALLRQVQALLPAAPNASPDGPPPSAIGGYRLPSPRAGATRQTHQRAPSPPKAQRTSLDASNSAAPAAGASAWWGGHSVVSVGPSGWHQAAGPTVGPPAGVTPFSDADVAFTPLLLRDDDGFIINSVLLGQEAALTAAITGISGQVGVSCVERARLLHSVWATARQLLAAVIGDRDTARSTLVSSKRAAAKAAEAMQLDIDRLRQNISTLNLQNDRLSSRDREQQAQLAAANAEISKLRKAMGNNDLDALQQQLAALQESHDGAQEELEQLRLQLAEVEADLADARQDLSLNVTRAISIEAQAIQMRDDLRARTPRPKRTLGCLGELLSEPGQQSAVFAALAAGALPAELHRLLLGVTHNGEDIRPWAGACGTCRGVVPPWTDAATHTAAFAPPPDNSSSGALAALLGNTGGKGGRSKSRPGSANGSKETGSKETGGAPVDGRSRPGSPTGSVTGSRGVPAAMAASLRKGVSFHGKRVAAAQAGNAAAGSGATGTAGSAGPNGASPDANGGLPPGMSPRGPRQSMHAGAGGEAAGAGGGASTGPATSARAPKVTMTPAQQTAHVKRTQVWLEDLIADGDVPLLTRLLPEDALDAVSSGTQLGCSPGAMACWLLGTLSPGGFNYVPYKDLTGYLAYKYDHGLNELGGPVTQALEFAALSTVQRVKTLEEKSQDLHREVVKLKRNLADHKRSERAKALAEEEAKLRKNANRRERTVHPVQAFIDAKWADFFMGLGTSSAIPKVMRHEGRIFNRRMDKVDAERMVNAIWDAKDEWQDKNKGSRMTLADFLVGYMTRKYVAPRAVIETVYNLIYTLGQHVYDPDCNLFIKCFMGEVDEGVRGEEEELLDDIVSMLTCVDRATHGKVVGFLPKRDMQMALKGFFSHKKALRMEEIMEALDTDCAVEVVHYRRLFDDDGDLNQGVFAETIRQQFLAERLEHLQVIEDCVFEAADRVRVKYMPPSLLRSALQSAMPDCTEDAIKQHMRMVYGLDARVRQAEAAAAAMNRNGAPPPPPASTVAAAAGGKLSAAVAALTGGAVLRSQGSMSDPSAGGDGEGEDALVPTVERVVALIRRGWVQQVPSIANAIKAMGLAAKLKLRLQSAISAMPAGESSSSSAKGGWGSTLAKLGRGPGAKGGSAGSNDGGGGADAAEGPSNASRMARAQAKRLKYIAAMDAVRDAWMQEEKTKVAQLAAQHGGRSGTGDGTMLGEVPQAAPEGPPLGPLPTAADFEDADDPELAALEAAQRMLSSHQAAIAAASAGSSTAPGGRMHSVSFGGSGRDGGGSEQNTPRLRRSTSMVGASAAAAAVDEVGERLQGLRALDEIIVALAEDRPDAPSANLDPETRKALYHDPADSDDDDEEEEDEDEDGEGESGGDGESVHSVGA